MCKGIPEQAREPPKRVSDTSNNKTNTFPNVKQLDFAHVTNFNTCWIKNS